MPSFHRRHDQDPAAGADVEHAAARPGQRCAVAFENEIDGLQRQPGGGVAAGAERGTGHNLEDGLARAGLEDLSGRG